MSNAPKDALEKTFQENFTQELTKYKWEAPEKLNGNLRRVTVKDLIDNWRDELNRINADILEGVELTDNEFQQVMEKVRAISNSFEAAKILAMENGKGKIDGINRDANPNVTHRLITLTIFRKADVRGGESSYQIAREVWGYHNNRFDMILLICGLPLINIEMKRSDHRLTEAFNQFKNYYKDGEYTHNFLAFSQMMVICSEIETKYFATPKNIKSFNEAFTFYWSDKNNNIINDWKKIVSEFLMVPMAHQMVADYLVICDDRNNPEESKHMVMRPYQVYALQSVELAASGQDGKCDGFSHGGYVWHTTGSGKTITSFKTALFLSTRAGFDKIVFLVDRRELDKNTRDKFKSYAAYETVDVDETKHIYNLERHLKSPKNGIIVTTIFKLNGLIKEMNANKDYSLANKKIVFIIDEAHRTTMGEMMGVIKTYFKEKGLFYGFTGTPLFDENNVKGMVNIKNEVIRTTEKLFGPLLHSYKINEAIRDGNVLPFQVYYIATGEFKSYEDLREQLISQYCEEDESRSRFEVEKAVARMDNLQIEKEARKHKIFYYNDKTHVPKVVENILEGWNKQSQGRKFNAILTVAQIERVVTYFEEFTRQQRGKENPIHIATTFSFGMENAGDTPARNFEPIMFDEYEKITGMKFIPGDVRSEEQYFEDLIERIKLGGSGRNDKNIDLVIVADQLLTGYDSKYLNTLYVDRNLELQTLVQAYSRTNRVLGREKEFGKIVNYKYPEITKECVDQALKLYGSGGTSSSAVVESYDKSVRKLADAIIHMKSILPNPTDWKNLESDSSTKMTFIKSYSNALEQLNRVVQYYEYQWNDNDFKCSEHDWKKYTGAFKNLTHTEPPIKPQIEMIMGPTRLVKLDDITEAYILRLIGEKTNVSGHLYSIDDESFRLILEKIQEFSDSGEADKAEQFKSFVTDLKCGRIQEDAPIDELFKTWKEGKMIEQISDYARKWGADKKLIEVSLHEFDIEKPDYIPMSEELVKTLDLEIAEHKEEDYLGQNIAFKKSLREWMLEMKRQYY